MSMKYSCLNVNSPSKMSVFLRQIGDHKIVILRITTYFLDTCSKLQIKLYSRIVNSSFTHDFSSSSWLCLLKQFSKIEVKSVNQLSILFDFGRSRSLREKKSSSTKSHYETSLAAICDWQLPRFFLQCKKTRRHALVRVFMGAFKIIPPDLYKGRKILFFKKWHFLHLPSLVIAPLG